MPSNIQEFEELTKQLAKHAEQMETLSRRAPAAAIDVCAVWKIAKPFVEGVIKLMNLLPFKWAKDVAAGLQILDDELTKLCPA